MASNRPTDSKFQYYCPQCVTCLTTNEPRCPECDAPRPSNGWPPVDDSPHPYLGECIDDRYVVDRFVDSGTSGHVYRARGQHFNQQVAIKIVDLARFDDEVRERVADQFRREVQILAQIRSPHVIDVYEALQLGEDVYGLVMNYVDGYTLDAILERQGRLDIDEAVSLLLQIANGLHEAHSHGIVHRDLKPANVMVEKLPASGDFARILDFGIAAAEGVDDHPGFQGTPLYASPEQCTEEALPDARSDIYGLGCLFFHLLTGQPPFPFTNALRVMDAHVEAPRPRLAEATDEVEFPEPLEHLVAHMLARAPEDRPDNLGVVHRDLSAFDRGEPMKHFDTLPEYRRDDSTSFSGQNQPITPPPGDYISLTERTSGELADESTFVDERDKTVPKFAPDIPLDMHPLGEHDMPGWEGRQPTVTACGLDQRGLACIVAESSPSVVLVGLGADPFEAVVDCEQVISAVEADLHQGLVLAADVRGRLLEIDPGGSRASEHHQLPASPLALEATATSRRAFVGLQDGRILLVDLRTESSHEIIRFHQAVSALAGPDDTSLLVGLWDGSIARIDDRRLQWHLPVAPDSVADVGVYDDNRYFALDAQGMLHIGDRRNGDVSTSLEIGPGLRTLTRIDDSQLRGMSLFDGQLQIWQIELEI